MCLNPPLQRRTKTAHETVGTDQVIGPWADVSPPLRLTGARTGEVKSISCGRKDESGEYIENVKKS